MRMVGRCLVCSRLISTWVSSLEPPPSTPSIVSHQCSHRYRRRRRRRHYHHQHQHHHRHYRHQNGSFPPPADTPLSRRSKFTSVSYVSPRPITDSSFSSRSRGSLWRPAALRLLLPPRAPTPLIVTQPSCPFVAAHRPRVSLSLSPLVDPWRSVLFGPVYPTGFALAKSRDSGLFTPFPVRTPARPRLPSLRLRRARIVARLSPSPNSSLAEGGRSFTPPASIRRFYASHPWVSYDLRVQSTRPSARRYEFYTEFREPGCGRGHRVATRHDAARRSARRILMTPRVRDEQQRRDGSSF